MHRPGRDGVLDFLHARGLRGLRAHSNRSRPGLLEPSPVQHPASPRDRWAAESTSTTSRSVSISSSPTSRPLQTLDAGPASAFSRSAAASAQTRSISLARERRSRLSICRKPPSRLRDGRSEVFGLEDRVTFIHANAETLEGVPVDPGYDLIYSFGVIHHTPHPERVLEQARKRLAPEGPSR